MTEFQEAPYCDGCMELSKEETALIKKRLLEIQEAFVSSMEIPVCDTFYLVSLYNKEYPEEVINGDTAEAVMFGD